MARISGLPDAACLTARYDGHMSTNREQRKLDYDVDAGVVVVSFPFDRELNSVLKSEIPGMRWDGSGKRWTVPPKQALLAARVLSARGFEITDTFSLNFLPGGSGIEDGEVLGGVRESLKEALLDEAAAKGLVRSPEPDPALPRGALDVSSLVSRIGNALKAEFPAPVWVVGTLLGFDKAAMRPGKALAFSLADWDESEARPICQIDAVMWSNVFEIVRSKFRKAGVELRDTLPVLMRVRVGMWAAQGKLQVYVDDCDPSYTVGKILKNLDALHDRLVREGLAGRNRSLPWPDVPLRVGLITSPRDGYGDFVKILSQSGFPFVVHFAESRVQGPETAAAVTMALTRLASEGVDCIALIRGGGASADLSWFNDYAIGRAICECPVPVIVGIGHDRDETLPDRLARSRSTPTAVAEFLVKQLQAIASARDARARSALSRVQGALDVARTTLGHRGRVLLSELRRRPQLERERLRDRSRRLRAAGSLPARVLAAALRKGDRLEFRVGSLLAQHRNRLLLDEKALVLRALQQTERPAHRDMPLREQRIRQAAARALERAGNRLEVRSRELNATADALVKQLQAIASAKDARTRSALSRVQVWFDQARAALGHRRRVLLSEVRRLPKVERQRLEDRYHRLQAAGSLPARILKVSLQRVERLEFHAGFLLAQHRSRLLLHEKALGLRARHRTERPVYRDLPLREQRLRQAAARALERAGQWLEARSRDLDARDPVKLLGRGYARLATPEGRIVRRARDLAPGADIRLRMADGTASALVTQVELRPPAGQPANSPAARASEEVPT